MRTETIKKMNIPYLLAVIFLPLVIAFAFSALTVWALGIDIGMWIIFALYVACIFWWIWGPSGIYNSSKKKHLAQLDQSSFVRNHTFNGDGCTVAADLVHGWIALIFKWNPGKYVILPANRITNLWVDDGKMLGGSSRVSFLFIIDGVKVRVNTFTSNKIWSMKSNYIREGLSKAETMVENLRRAYAAANGEDISGNLPNG